MRTFLVRYNYAGAEYGLEIMATDAAEAKARVARLAYATLDGELIANVPAALGPVAVVVAAVRNGVARFLGIV